MSMSSFACYSQSIKDHAVAKVCPKEWKDFQDALTICAGHNPWRNAFDWFCKDTQEIESGGYATGEESYETFDLHNACATIGAEMIDALWTKVCDAFHAKTKLQLGLFYLSEDNSTEYGLGGYIQCDFMEVSQTYKDFLKEYYPKAYKYTYGKGKTFPSKDKDRDPADMVTWVAWG